MGNQKKQFGIWLDGSEAFVVGKKNIVDGPIALLGHIKALKNSGNSSENAANNQQKTEEQKFFKEITSYMQNAEEAFVTGTGVAQEKFVNYLSETPQFKNTKTKTDTSNKMSEDKLIAFFEEKF